jgi:hypothetical protein
MPDDVGNEPDNQDEDERRRRERAAALIAMLSLGDWSGLAPDLADDLAPMYADGLRATGFSGNARTVNEARANLGLDPVDDGDNEPDIIDDMPDRADSWAQGEADDLVTGLKDRTKGMLLTTLVAALAAGWSAARIEREIAASPAFSDARVDTIAHVETVNAETAGRLVAITEGGVATGKVWVTENDDLVEEICEENESDGPIAADEVFSSGDDGPPAHPNCRCYLEAFFGEL